MFELPQLPADKLMGMKRFLADKPVYGGHAGANDGEELTLHECVASRRWSLFHHWEQDVIQAPYLLDLASELYEIADGHFQGERAALYSVHVFYSQPSADPNTTTQAWHRDPNDYRQMGMFMYGEDVIEPTDGAHQYEMGSQILDCPHLEHWHEIIPFYETRGGPINQANRPMHPDRCKTFLGPAGTRFLIDPSGFHMGIRPNKLRMLFWARFAPGRQTIREKYPHLQHLMGKLR